MSFSGNFHIKAINCSLKRDRNLYENIDMICNLFFPKDEKFYKTSIARESGINSNWKEDLFIRLNNEQNFLLIIKDFCEHSEESIFGENIVNISNFKKNQENRIEIPLFYNGENVGNAEIEAKLID